MINFKDVKFEEIVGIVDFLYSRETAENEDEKIFATAKKFQAFFKDIDAEKAIALNVLVGDIIKKNEAEKGFKELQLAYPDLQFDEEGKTKNNINYAELPLRSLEILYQFAEELLKKHDWKDPYKHNVNLQIYYAKTLGCLEGVKPSTNYSLDKASYFKWNKEPVISKEDLKNAENMCEWLCGKNSQAIKKFFAYISGKKYDNCKTFVNHFLTRLELAYNDKDHYYESTNEFIENLKKIS